MLLHYQTVAKTKPQMPLTTVEQQCEEIIQSAVCIQIVCEVNVPPRHDKVIIGARLICK